MNIIRCDESKINFSQRSPVGKGTMLIQGPREGSLRWLVDTENPEGVRSKDPWDSVLLSLSFFDLWKIIDRRKLG